MSIIYQTTNYEQFHFFKRNRPIVGKKIIESIRKNNMLHAHPIHVTPDFWVIDGQNRLTAAKSLGVPIYYIIDENATQFDIVDCQTQNPWKASDYLNFYNDKNFSYQYVQEIYQKYTFPLYFIIKSCCTLSSSLDKFREGTYRITKEKGELDVLFSNLNEIVTLISTFYKNVIRNHIYVSLWSLIAKEDYSHKKMLHKIKKYKDGVLDAFEYTSASRVQEKLIEKVYHF